MARYQIVDEPNVKSWGESLILDPTIILFVCIFAPILISIPAFGRFWIPLIWLSLNGFALGSATLKRELLVLWLGSVLLFSVYIGFIAVANHYGLAPERINPYLRIMVFAGFFLVIYITVFNQQKSYELFKYLHSNQL